MSCVLQTVFAKTFVTPLNCCDEKRWSSVMTSGQGLHLSRLSQKFMLKPVIISLH